MIHRWCRRWPRASAAQKMASKASTPVVTRPCSLRRCTAAGRSHVALRGEPVQRGRAREASNRQQVRDGDRLSLERLRL